MATQPNTPKLSATVTDGVLRLSGDFTVWTVDSLPAEARGARIIELSDVRRFDTAAANYLAGRERDGATVRGLSEVQAALLSSVRKAAPKPEPQPQPPHGWRATCEQTGRQLMAGKNLLRELAEYLGRFLAAIGRTIRNPGEFRFTSLVYHCQETGLRAVPIVALMSFLIGVVLAFQGASQLQRFGAEIFVVDLIAIAILRELGILLTAIIVAGRTASALTAAIGSMKMNEEIDAMRTLGLDPDMVLLLPRVLALIITLPILGLIADISGLVGGGLMSWIDLGISPPMFTHRLLSDTDVSHVFVGMIKAPVFALIIGIIGCHAGMKVGNNAESLGAQTSGSVVRAIFAVIVADALFSIFFSEIGL